MSERMTAAEYLTMNNGEIKSKYGSVRVTVDGIRFDSKAESERYHELKLLERAGEISELRLQTRYELIPKQAGERAVTYKVDFDYMECGRHVVEDVKGHKAQQYIIRRKLFKSRYPDIEFREIR